MAAVKNPPSKVVRLLVVVLVSLLVEGIRYYIHPALYIWQTWLLVGSSLAMNTGYHMWSLPQTYPKVLISAFYNQTALPYVAIYLWQFLIKLIPPLPAGSP